MPLGLAQGSPGACLVIPLSSSRQAGMGTLVAVGMERGAQKGAQIVLEGKEGLPIPTPELLHCTPVSGSALHWCALLFSLLVPLISHCRRGRGLGARDAAIPTISISPGLAEPFETQVLLCCRGEELQSSEEPAAKIPPWAYPVPRGWQGCYFTVILYVFL